MSLKSCLSRRSVAVERSSALNMGFSLSDLFAMCQDSTKSLSMALLCRLRQRLGFGHHILEHLGRQPSGIGVVARAMIAGNQLELADGIGDAMLKGMGSLARPQRVARRIMGDLAQGQDHFHAGEGFQLAF